ncbi:MBL fold metallo-hydrolase [Alicyclobacillus fastidiosus]|uniref:MBL fold metallo-hydrolase n=1 Tax=Alicyclobacillus fastidiosus TaxID=392011 RepID=A0ABY6ZGT0_9BACL|nr:MBL fold metallo-hydrolase [Alicyclobacillus fastidiosus]WAH41421.1 MBL fold metallo-hydrolase [Alicyclobacillus fastidiosus]GMA63044.1 MBL fold metallo-hydrolase [Alicyclobacillus fastidiosus]
MTKVYKVGDVTVTRVTEMTISGIQPEIYFPGSWSPAFLKENRDTLPSGVIDSNSQLIVSIGTWVVKTPNHTILIDTATGNDKNLPYNPDLSNLQLPYLERLKDAGVTPEDVDYVLLTHLHVDHVGWNTRLVDGKWVPTFPNAKYVLPLSEQQYYSSTASHNKANEANFNAYEESVLPVVEAGLTQTIGPEGGEFLDIFKFIPSPGHSIGQMSISLTSGGEEALFGADVMHHPFQVYNPEWNSMYCEFAEQARISRRWALNYVADRPIIYFSTHFPESAAGYVTRSGNGFKWEFI